MRHTICMKIMWLWDRIEQFKTNQLEWIAFIESQNGVGWEDHWKSSSARQLKQSHLELAAQGNIPMVFEYLWGGSFLEQPQPSSELKMYPDQGALPQCVFFVVSQGTTEKSLALSALHFSDRYKDIDEIPKEIRSIKWEK